MGMEMDDLDRENAARLPELLAPDAQDHTGVSAAVPTSGVVALPPRETRPTLSAPADESNSHDNPLNSKSDYVVARIDKSLELIKLGLPPYRACLLAGFEDAEIDLMLDDARYIRRVEFTTAKHEQELLERLETIIRANIKRGISTELRFMLEHRDPETYGKKVEVGGDGFLDLPRPTMTLSPGKNG